jgi:hypothetical protein
MRNNTTHSRQKNYKSSAPTHFSPLEALEARQLMSASVYTVTNTLDNSHHGSLRWAINQVNKDAGKKGSDTINFDIAGTGTQTIAPLSQLPTIKYSVTIDGTTQPGYSGTPLIDINGDAMTGGGGGDALVVQGNGSIVKGLAIDHFTRGIVASGTYDLITENVLGSEAPSFNGVDDGFSKAIDVYGSNTTVTNNTIDSHEGSGIMLESQSNSNIVVTNFVTDGQFGINDSVDSDSNEFYGNTVAANYYGFEIDGHHNQVGDGTWANSNTIGRSDLPNAIGVELNSGQNQVFANEILFNGEVGVYMGYNDSATDTVTGQVKSIAGNHNTVEGNFIGYNGQNGITLDHVRGNVIGAAGSFSGGDTMNNTLMHNTFDGIYVGTGSAQNTFSENYIDQNGSLGIELAAGANDSQNAPTLNWADAYGWESPYVNTSFTGAANSTYHIEFFATYSGTPNQGANYFGSVDITTDSQGYMNGVSSTDTGTYATVYGSGSTAVLGVSFQKEIASDQTVFTATATNQAGSTSAFSNGITVQIDS